MCKFFTDSHVNYKVILAKNLNYKEFMGTCRYLATHQNYILPCTTMVVYFSGHGSNGNIIMQDGKPVKIKDILAELCKFHTKGRNKPNAKILLLDACRGTKSDPGMNFAKSKAGSVTKRNGDGYEVKCPSNSNSLVAYATAEDYFAYNLDFHGGYWSEELIEQLNALKGKDIEVILKEVHKMCQKPVTNDQEYQGPEYISRLSEPVIFWQETGMLLSTHSGAGVIDLTCCCRPSVLVTITTI